MKRFRVGSKVTHKRNPAWGIGRVWEVRNNGRVSVHWALDFADESEPDERLQSLLVPGLPRLKPGAMRRHYKTTSLNLESE